MTGTSTISLTKRALLGVTDSIEGGQSMKIKS